MIYCDAIVDLQSGDTGKGKVAHFLAPNYDLVMRYNGGSNAGHTIYQNEQKYVTHQVPAGVFHGIQSLIGVGCVVNVQKLEAEISSLNSFNPRVLVDYRAHVVTDAHIEEDSDEIRIGTTGQGIGPCYRDKYARKGLQVKDLPKSPLFTVVDSLEVFKTSNRVLAEGAQGYKLDINWGDYPYVTSSGCTIGSVISSGIPPRKLVKVYGVMKAYETYIGSKEFTTPNHYFDSIASLGNEIGATTGRPRQVNWVNLDELAVAIELNGVTDLIVNKLDVLEQLGTYGFIKNGKVTITTSLEEFILAFDFCNITWSRSRYSV